MTGRWLVMLGVFGSVASAAPMELSHQGRLIDSVGTPVNASGASLVVGLYASESASTPVWEDTFTTDITDGYYAVTLGSGVELDSDDFLAAELWVGTDVGGQDMGRQKLVSVPFAVDAFSASELNPRGRNLKSQAGTSCKAIQQTLSSPSSGLYWLDPNLGSTDDAFLAHCDMQTSNGGWTHVMTVNPGDGNHVSWMNEVFWRNDAEYGAIGSHFTNDYKGPAAWQLAGNELLIAIYRPGPVGQLLGWKHWNLAGTKTLDSFFEAPVNTTQTAGVVDQFVGGVYGYEPLIGAPEAFSAHSDELASNRSYNPNGDRVRLSAVSYSPNGDDNQPGLGTNMNGTHSSNPHGGYWASGDVELWVNSSSNLWCTHPGPGSYKLVGTDYGCGTGCDDCLARRTPAYPESWTYRIFVRE